MAVSTRMPGHNQPCQKRIAKPISHTPIVPAAKASAVLRHRHLFVGLFDSGLLLARLLLSHLLRARLLLFACHILSSLSD